MPKPSATLIRTVPPTASGSPVRSAAAMACRAASPASSNRAPAAVSCRPVAERMNRVAFSADSSRPTRRPTVAVLIPRLAAAAVSEPRSAAATNTLRSSQSKDIDFRTSR